MSYSAVFPLKNKISVVLSKLDGIISNNARASKGKKFFSKTFPKYLREGPWHRNSKVFLGLALLGMVLSGFIIERSNHVTRHVFGSMVNFQNQTFNLPFYFLLVLLIQNSYIT